MKIEKIQKCGSKYKITLDNGEVINTFDDVILNNNLLYDKSIDSDLLNKINTDTIYYESYNKAIKMIGRRLRSEFEIRQYLDKCMVLDSDRDKIIETLKRIGLIDDYRFARAYTNDKINLSLDGPYKISRNLEQFKVDGLIINEVISGIDQDIVLEHLNKIVNKKVSGGVKGSEYMFKNKLMNYLINLGYERSMINLVLNDISLGVSTREMEKEYKRLAKKFSGDELLYKLRNKLFSKGYKLEDINNFIDEKNSSLI